MKSQLFFFFLLILFILSCENKEDIKVITFNIRYNNVTDGKNKWELRKRKVLDFIKSENPDIIGLQEVLHSQYTFLKKKLPKYDFVGVGRDDGKTKGEYAPILFRKDKYKVLRHSTFWLSETPSKAGSKDWAKIPRIAVWAIIEDIKTQKNVFCINTHFDNQSIKARLHSATLLLYKIKKLADNMPIVLMGDFNMSLKDEAYKILVGNWESYESIRNCMPEEILSSNKEFTFNGFGKIKSKNVIDHIFVSNEFEVKQSNIKYNNDTFPYLSDHFPVIAHLRIKEKEEKPKYFSKELEISAFAPKTNNKKRLFQDKIELDIFCETEDADIFYTTDGSIPTRDSKKVEGKLIFDKSVTLSLRAFHNKLKASEVTVLNLYKGIIRTGGENNFPQVYDIIPFKIKKKLNSVTDGIFGENIWDAEKWAGKEGEDLKILIDLGEKKDIKKITGRFLQDLDYWVFLPLSIKVSCSKDGKNFNTISETVVSEKTKANSILSSSLEINSKIRYIKVEARNRGTCPEWHQGAGEKAWIACDEIIIEPK